MSDVYLSGFPYRLHCIQMWAPKDAHAWMYAYDRYETCVLTAKLNHSVSLWQCAERQQCTNNNKRKQQVFLILYVSMTKLWFISHRRQDNIWMKVELISITAGVSCHLKVSALAALSALTSHCQMSYLFQNTFSEWLFFFFLRMSHTSGHEQNNNTGSKRGFNGIVNL